VALTPQNIEGTWRRQTPLEGDDLVISDLHDGRFRVVLTHHSDVGFAPPEETTAHFEGGFLRLKEPMQQFNGRVAGVLLVSIQGQVVLATDAELPAIISCAAESDRYARELCVNYSAFRALR
jgi:hypothetical protein